MGRRKLPFRVLTPSVLQASHIGYEGGLHATSVDMAKVNRYKAVTKFGPFHDKVPNVLTKQAGLDVAKIHDKGYGGWGHPADHDHCVKLFG